MNEARTYDPVWDKIYGDRGMLNRYPFDSVVSFVYRHAPKNVGRRDIRILEVGCGAGNNLWFAAREGFSVTGIDGSKAAIDFAQNRFAEEGLEGDLRVGDMTRLPFSDAIFDLAIDRAGITCLPFTAAGKAVAEVQRVLKEGGSFFFNPYSTESNSFSESDAGTDGLRCNIRGGTLVGVGEICFYSDAGINNFFSSGWKIQCKDHLQITNTPSTGIHAEWRVIARKQTA